MKNVDHVLFIGFGGPEKLGDVAPFLQNVSGGKSIPEARLKQVQKQYELLGGKSHYNDGVFAMQRLVDEMLQAYACDMPTFVGMRNWNPYLKDAVAAIQAQGLKKGLAIILAPFRSESSFGRYQTNLKEAKQVAGADALEYRYTEDWHAHAYFIKAHTASIRKAIGANEKVHIIFANHSIPDVMAEQCGYKQDFEDTGRIIAKHFPLNPWSVAYQSRSGNSAESWLGPDIDSHIAHLARQGINEICLVPLGFLCENAEISFDLDIQATATAQKEAMKVCRCETIIESPEFIHMYTELIMKAII